MTPERIAELRALAAQAAPGPWKIHPSKGGDPTVVCIVERFDLSIGAVEAGSEWGVFHRKDAAFIAAARTALPEALTEIERLRFAMKYAAGEIRRQYQDLSPVSAGDNHELWLSEPDGNEIADNLHAALEGKSDG